MKTLQVFILACLLLKNLEAVPLASFYSFGSSAGDTSLPRNDDGYSSLITLTTRFPYFGTNPNTLYVSVLISSVCVTTSMAVGIVIMLEKASRNCLAGECINFH